MSLNNQDSFITVVAVGAEDKTQNGSPPKNALNHSDFVTVLTISNDESKSIADITEEVVVYRLPGERLGFGLKFEGGTKANEYVKRLFIQSCAPDSPASRVQSSWGQLVEGDEVLQIESITVNTMTRIDCVRLLKDSKVAIKLLVRHYCDNKHKSKSTEDLPVIISTEEKRPPPVPPRKIPRKAVKTTNALKEESQNLQENIVPSIRQNNNVNESFLSKSSRLQSPRGSGRSLGKSYYSPDVSRRDRRFSDGSLGPPDAEVYVDLFSQDSTLSLSESDDTGSTISTVLDRFGSFPTTTTSSFAGSLPSTPTSIQKQLDLSYIINEYDDDEISQINNNNNKIIKQNVFEENNNIITNNNEVDPLCFQDAPLSYGNENTTIFPEDEFNSTLLENNKTNSDSNIKIRPAIIPRQRDKIQQNTPEPLESENPTLPRLVDFVPKSLRKKEDDNIETLKQFLECERFDFEGDHYDYHNDDIDLGMDIYNPKWILSSHLDTIGEVEEEGIQDTQNNYRSNNNCTPLVIIENADLNKEKLELDNDSGKLLQEESNELMEGPPIDFRQPPDGHEFPDFMENSNKPLVEAPTFEIPIPKTKTSKCESVQDNITNSSINTINLLLDKSISSSNYDLRSKMYESDDEKFNHSPFSEKSNLHTRSQSLIDMSFFSKEKNSKWNSMVEQRKKSLSKLKGLVIPEQNENEVAPSVIIPEIKSFTPITVSVPNLLEENQSISVDMEVKNEVIVPKPSTLPFTTSWAANSTIPKYSPAFKRKSLQVYPIADKKNDTESIYGNYLTSTKVTKTSDSDEMNPPKSLESISSPTRSDCSFDYISNSGRKNQKDNYECFINNKTDNLLNRDCKVEDESDNDSAVSSSQSSYNSRFSPPLSPTRPCEPKYDSYSEKLHFQTSAKCRSGKDIKIGSPVIQRKNEDSDKNTETVQRIVEGKCEIKLTNGTETSKTKIIKEEERVPKVLVTSGIVREYKLRPTTGSVEIKKSSLLAVEAHKPNLKESYSVLSKQVKPVNVKALKQNFENPASSSNVPLFPKNYNQETKVVIPKKTEKMDSKLTPKTTVEIKKYNKELKTKSNPVPQKSESSTNLKEVKFVELILENIGGSLGITLAGGADYENKEITVHRIRYGSVADQDGRLNKGDKIISINGNKTEGLTHAAAVELLKEPCKKFVIETEICSDIVPSTSSRLSISSTSSSVKSEPKSPVAIISDKKPNHVISIIKDGAGLGFSIEGGKDSPNGDVPLTVKKIFFGGAAHKSGELKVGDEILFMNDIEFKNLNRIEAWSMMKKIPDGNVKIQIFR